MGPGFTAAPNLEEKQVVLPSQGTPMTARGPQPRWEQARQCAVGLSPTCASRRRSVRPFSSQTWPGGTVLPLLDTVVGCVLGEGCSPGALLGPTRGPGASPADFQGRGEPRTKAWLCGGSGV